MGVKPFYYYLSEKSFFFSTEIKALLLMPEVPNEVNELKVAFYLSNVITDKKLTFYKDIFSLTAAHSLTLAWNKSIIRRYWAIDPDLKIKKNSDKDYIEAFNEIFAEAVNCRLRSAFPIGFELSGGLDSSSVVCMAKNISNNKNHHIDINTFSMIFEDFPDVDESFYINKIIETGGINHCFVLSDKISPLKKIDNILFYQEQPFVTT